MEFSTTQNGTSASAIGEKQVNAQKSDSKLEKISFYILLATIFLAPLAFVSGAYAPLDVVKTVVISFGLLISFILYAIPAIKNRTLSIPKSSLTYSIFALIISIIISTFLSTSFAKSFGGQSFEFGTTSSLLLMFCATFFIARRVSLDKEKIFSIYSAILCSFVILALFHIVRFFGGDQFLTLGLLTSPISTVLGKWYDLAIFAGLVGVLSLLGIKFLSSGKALKSLLIVLVVISGFFLFVINFALVWWMVATVLLALVIYEFHSRVPQGTGVMKKFVSRISIISVIVLVIAIACAWKGNTLAGGISHALKVDQGELILPWQMTLDVAANTVKQTPFFGAGPNRFGIQFLQFKPQGINSTNAWTAEFTNGVGTIPTFLVTQGVVGMILWCLFFIFFIRLGMLALKKAIDPFKKFAILSSFLGALFLWLMNIVYVPSQVIVFFTFIFTGLFIASLVDEHLVLYKEIGKEEGARIRKYTPIVLSIALAVMILWLGFYIKKTVAIAYFESGIRELNANHATDIAQTKFKKALAWDVSDVYYQGLSETDVMKITDLTNQIQSQTGADGKGTPDPKLVQQVISLVGEAVDYSKKAIAFDPTNYYNYLAQEHISEIGASLQIPNAYENAESAYANAITANPSNPSLYLGLAHLHATHNDLTLAQQDIGKALQLKDNYTEAIFLLSQIQVSNGQLKDAIISTQVAIQTNPNDPTLYFQLGLLDYNDKNYTDAATALEKAVALNSQYANARYFLGLADARLGKDADAIDQFTELAKTNPDNKEVAFILSNLQAGKSPFTDVKPPLDSKPEKRSALPVTTTN